MGAALTVLAAMCSVGASVLAGVSYRCRLPLAKELSVGVVLALTFLWTGYARADVITEFGGGWKLPYTTSIVLWPECHAVVPLLKSEVEEITAHDVTKREIIESVEDRKLASCGGDNPPFIGWPIAWQSKDFGQYQAMSWRVGWFHMSHWLDGKSDRETHMDCLCAVFTMNWSARRRGKE